ncbi:hypothetical protein [Porphyrobacter sp. AAP82]|uniref:hypothetical protein n=1 Tax=Porphyrobacter sp. AAP82 TaxID=1248917 RepID=UPI0018C8C512|nr:hypothetical protein [Porphyrobacter sp. AAP82]
MILNVSQRGLLASSSTPPPRGHYVEIRKGGVVIIGRVAWSGNQVFGVRTQDEIDVPGLAGIRPAGMPDFATKAGEKDRAATLRRPYKAAPLSAYEQSRIVSSRMNYVASLIVSCAFAAAAGVLAYEMLSEPIETIRGALSPRDNRSVR